MPNQWVQFLQTHKGLGFSRDQLRRKYHSSKQSTASQRGGRLTFAHQHTSDPINGLQTWLAGTNLSDLEGGRYIVRLDWNGHHGGRSVIYLRFYDRSDYDESEYANVRTARDTPGGEHFHLTLVPRTGIRPGWDEQDVRTNNEPPRSWRDLSVHFTYSTLQAGGQSHYYYYYNGADAEMTPRTQDDDSEYDDDAYDLPTSDQSVLPIIYRMLRAVNFT